MKLCILWSCNITLGWFRNCRGDSNIKCGGIWKMQVYRIPTVNEAGLIPGETVVHGWQRLLTQRLHEFRTRGTERMVFTHPSNNLSHGVKSFCFNPIKRLCKSRARDLTKADWGFIEPLFEIRMHSNYFPLLLQIPRAPRVSPHLPVGKFLWYKIHPLAEGLWKKSCPRASKKSAQGPPKSARGRRA